jgi:hypothetical protein
MARYGKAAQRKVERAMRELKAGAKVSRKRGASRKK